MIAQVGDRTPEMRRGPERQRERLTIRNPRVEMALAGLPIDDSVLTDARRFGNRLVAEAERWQMRGACAERGRISKRDAAAMWARVFPATAVVMAHVRRGGAE